MRHKRWSVLLGILISFAVALPLCAQDESKAPVEVDGSDIQRELHERQQKIEKLAAEEREALGAAHVRANADPVVQEALSKRNAAIYEFRLELYRAMVRVDPSLEAILQKVEFIRVQGQRQ